MNSTAIYIDFDNQYPFGHNLTSLKINNPPQPRKALPLNSPRLPLFKQKIKILKHLPNQHLIAPTALFEDQNHLYLVFETVQTSFAKNKKISSSDGLESLRKQLTLLAQTLAQNAIEHSLKASNIGLGPKNNLKYYLGLNFNVVPNMEKAALLSRYKEDIDEIILSKINSNFEEEIRVSWAKDYDYCNGRTSLAIAKNVEEHPPLLKRSQTDTEKAIIEPMTKKRSPESITRGLNKTQNSKPTNQQKAAPIKMLKVSQLGTRINKLKQTMKQILSKTPNNNSPTNQLAININGNNYNQYKIPESKGFVSPKFNKYEKQVTDFRESLITQAEHQIRLTHSPKNQIGTPNLCLAQEIRMSNTIKQNSHPIDSPLTQRLSHNPNKTARSPPTNEPSSPNSERNIKPPRFPSLPKDNDRKAKQYMQLAQSDKYCEQFMNFLQEKEQQTNSPKSNEIKKTVKTYSNKTLPTNSRSTEQLAKDKTEHFSTECSQKGAVQLHEKVKDVIRNSIKIINTLRFKESNP